jgi:hypothetical protein
MRNANEPVAFSAAWHLEEMSGHYQNLSFIAVNDQPWKIPRVQDNVLLCDL